MTLLETQKMFAMYAAALIQKAIELGYDVTLGDAYRDPRAFGGLGEKGPYGADRSAHKNRLAVDLNLFKGTRYLSGATDHLELGTWWKAQHPLARWGGDFRDANHYSFEHDGVS